LKEQKEGAACSQRLQVMGESVESLRNSSDRGNRGAGCSQRLQVMRESVESLRNSTDRGRIGVRNATDREWKSKIHKNSDSESLCPPSSICFHNEYEWPTPEASHSKHLYLEPVEPPSIALI